MNTPTVFDFVESTSLKEGGKRGSLFEGRFPHSVGEMSEGQRGTGVLRWQTEGLTEGVTPHAPQPPTTVLTTLTMLQHFI